MSEKYDKLLLKVLDTSNAPPKRYKHLVPLLDLVVPLAALPSAAPSTGSPTPAQAALSPFLGSGSVLANLLHLPPFYPTATNGGALDSFLAAYYSHVFHICFGTLLAHCASKPTPKARSQWFAELYVIVQHLRRLVCVRTDLIRSRWQYPSFTSLLLQLCNRCNDVRVRMVGFDLLLCVIHAWSEKQDEALLNVLSYAIGDKRVPPPQALGAILPEHAISLPSAEECVEDGYNENEEEDQQRLVELIMSLLSVNELTPQTGFAYWWTLLTSRVFPSLSVPKSGSCLAWSIVVRRLDTWLSPTNPKSTVVEKDCAKTILPAVKYALHSDTQGLGCAVARLRKWVDAAAVGQHGGTFVEDVLTALRGTILTRGGLDAFCAAWHMLGADIVLPHFLHAVDAILTTIPLPPFNSTPSPAPDPWLPSWLHAPGGVTLPFGPSSQALNLNPYSAMRIFSSYSVSAVYNSSSTPSTSLHITNSFSPPPVPSVPPTNGPLPNSNTQVDLCFLAASVGSTTHESLDIMLYVFGVLWVRSRLDRKHDRIWSLLSTLSKRWVTVPHFLHCWRVVLSHYTLAYCSSPSPESLMVFDRWLRLLENSSTHIIVAKALQETVMMMQSTAPPSAVYILRRPQIIEANTFLSVFGRWLVLCYQASKDKDVRLIAVDTLCRMLDKLTPEPVRREHLTTILSILASSGDVWTECEKVLSRGFVGTVPLVKTLFFSPHSGWSRTPEGLVSVCSLLWNDLQFAKLVADFGTGYGEELLLRHVLVYCQTRPAQGNASPSITAHASINNIILQWDLPPMLRGLPLPILQVVDTCFRSLAGRRKLKHCPPEFATRVLLSQIDDLDLASVWMMYATSWPSPLRSSPDGISFVLSTYGNYNETSADVPSSSPLLVVALGRATLLSVHRHAVVGSKDADDLPAISAAEDAVTIVCRNKFGRYVWKAHLSYGEHVIHNRLVVKPDEGMVSVPLGPVCTNADGEPLNVLISRLHQGRPSVSEVLRNDSTLREVQSHRTMEGLASKSFTAYPLEKSPEHLQQDHAVPAHVHSSGNDQGGSRCDRDANRAARLFAVHMGLVPPVPHPGFLTYFDGASAKVARIFAQLDSLPSRPVVTVPVLFNRPSDDREVQEKHSVGFRAFMLAMGYANLSNALEFNFTSPAYDARFIVQQGTMNSNTISKVQIVWDETNTEYVPQVVGSQSPDVVIVIHPNDTLGNTVYGDTFRIRVLVKDGVSREIGPLRDFMLVTRVVLAHLVRETAIQASLMLTSVNGRWRGCMDSRQQVIDDLISKQGLPHPAWDAFWSGPIL